MRQNTEKATVVEHINAEHKQWRTLQRYLGRREYFGESYSAVAGLVSDRTDKRWSRARQPARPSRPHLSHA
ncbi:hypothetical protein ABT025_36365 [Streptomyces sp. NPDC002809]|uniref:hypothetical protein n=1 Tax=Streptomyces sp. NPDC002809 TaxID=3154433 RepID=UPI00332AD250